jgi:hypothetical protein
MTTFEKVAIVIISAFMSVLANLLYRYLDRRHLKKALRSELSLLAENLEAAIINNNTAECRPSVENLISNYVIFHKDKIMVANFRKVLGIYTFLHNGGYDEDPSRKEHDLQVIQHVRDKLR